MIKFRAFRKNIFFHVLPAIYMWNNPYPLKREAYMIYFAWGYWGFSVALRRKNNDKKY